MLQCKSVNNYNMEDIRLATHIYFNGQCKDSMIY